MHTLAANEFPSHGVHFEDPFLLAVPFGQIVQSVLSALLLYPAGQGVQLRADPSFVPTMLML